MTTPKRLIPLLSVLACAAPAAGEAKPYDLGRIPQFAPGDRVAVRKSEVVSSKLQAGGQTVFDRRQALHAELEQEVLQADAEKGVTAFRTRIISARKSLSDAAGQSDKPQEVGVEDVWVDVKLQAGRFAANTETVASGKHQALSAQQLALVKRLMIRQATFEGYSRGDAVLMPPQPVPAGTQWTPPPQMLQQWIEGKPSLPALGAKVESAGLRLASVKDSVATVYGRMHLSAQVEGRKLAPTIDVILRIDTSSGRWLSRISQMKAVIGLSDGSTASSPPSGQTQTITVDREEVMSYQAGAGRPTSRPADLRDLGWRQGPPDANSYRNAAAGLSIDVPKGYSPAREVQIAPPLVAAFAAEGVSITVSAKDLGRLIELDDLAEIALKNLKDTLADYKPQSRRTLALADNVPAVLLKGQQADGRLTVLTIVAVDGTRLASATAVSAGSTASSSPSGDAAQADKLEKTLTSLRMFEPELVDRPQAARNE